MLDKDGNKLIYDYKPFSNQQERTWLFSAIVQANGFPVDAPKTIGALGFEQFSFNECKDTIIYPSGLIAYSCGPSFLSQHDVERFIDYDFISYFYEQGSYEGGGALIGVKGNLAITADLGHCSCYGPTDEIKIEFVDIEKVLNYDQIDPNTGLERSPNDFDYDRWGEVTRLVKKAFGK